ncbi:hypothetical protein BDQ12DRAFT_690301 [Crucibulum laeve]|uniref:Uncharacterized protein n=1 Tax=Crucibulum laeve TaxID=68775 RepID=A0A5C3LMV6_9AGAR|nr:hypothetical protein BDQ12DRAFT_690301 [Crucibulum laeve]
MARGTRASPPASSLPKVSFEKVPDDLPNVTYSGHERQAKSYGYIDDLDFNRPDHYIRHIDPLEADLARQVEYDMDEQDQEWLDAVNVERKKHGMDLASYEMFEIIMDRLEKEWFDLTKNIPKPDLVMPSEDSTCAICDDSEGENSNAIVFCDGCNLAVHQDCYGVPYIPEGQWLCRKCTVSPEIPVQCILCPNEGGAFKQTTHGDWVHLLCAIWVPETRVANEVFMEPITGVEKISKQRWKLKCNVCDIREGACIQCAKTSCFLAFHATCARKEKLLLPMKTTPGAEPTTLTCYCERHLPQEQQDAREAALAAEPRTPTTPTDGFTKLTAASKSARAYAKTYKPGPPLVPALIVDRILNYVQRMALRGKLEFIQMLCRYWSLKREARRGAPLLKRLHLEPWTASAGGKVQTVEERMMKLEQLRRLRQDLIKVKALAELTRAREGKKLEQAETIHQVLSEALFPHEGRLRMAFERIMSHDKSDYFKNPVSKSEVPDYYNIIKNPMCWAFIDAKLDKHEYWDIQAFKDDIDLVISNAILYNKPGTPFYKAAIRIQNASRRILEDLTKTMAKPIVPLPTANGNMNGIHRPEINGTDDIMQVDSPIDTEFRTEIGDLEPPIEMLELLFSSDIIKDDMDLILEDDPVTSLLNYEFGKMKSPPPLPTPPPPRPKKPQRDRKAEAERRAARKAAEAEAAVEANPQEILDASPGFRAPRTRRAYAAAAAFEAEAEAQVIPINPAAEASEPPTPSQSSSAPPSKRGRKPGSVSLPSHPKIVDDVDRRGSFAMFNAGWILPEEQKRGGRSYVERQPMPPPRKKARTDSGLGGSRLSVFSTAASDNETLKTSPRPSEAPEDQQELYHYEDAMDMDAEGELEDHPPSEPPETPAEADTSIQIDDSEAGNISIQMEESKQLENAMEIQEEPTDVSMQAEESKPVSASLLDQESASATISFQDKQSTQADMSASAKKTNPQQESVKRATQQDEISGPVDNVATFPRLTTPSISSYKRSPGGTIIIEELDSPATRKEKSLRRRAERTKAKSAAVEFALAPAEPVTTTELAASIIGLSAQTVEPAANNGAKKNATAGSELSSLSESSSSVSKRRKRSVSSKTALTGPRTESTQISTRSKAAKAAELADPGLVPDGKNLEGGTLVWAKIGSYPWWPAVVFEEDHPAIPGHVYKTYKATRAKRKKRLHIVQFFDKNKSWQFLMSNHLRMLGESEILDQDMLATVSVRQKWKNNDRELCRQAFRDAMAEMEKPGEEDDDEEAGVEAAGDEEAEEEKIAGGDEKAEGDENEDGLGDEDADGVAEDEEE